jgi:hypothetical protein
MHLVPRLAAVAALISALAGPMLGSATAASGSTAPVGITPNPSTAGTRTTFAVNCSSLTASGPAIYGATWWPTLRLITCGGRFDPSTGHYLANTVVFAEYAGQRG